MRILNAIQLALCLFATGWLTTAASSGWKAGPPPQKNPPATGGSFGGTHYYGVPYSTGASRSFGGSFGGGK